MFPFKGHSQEKNCEIVTLYCTKVRQHILIFKNCPMKSYTKLPHKKSPPDFQDLAISRFHTVYVCVRYLCAVSRIWDENARALPVRG
jgi:hypothetical protein